MLTYLVCGQLFHICPIHSSKDWEEHTEQLMVKTLKKKSDCLLHHQLKRLLAVWLARLNFQSELTFRPCWRIYVRLSSYTLQVLLLWDDWRGWEELVGHAHHLQTAWSCEEKHWLVTKSNILIYVLLTHTHIAMLFYIFTYIYTHNFIYTHLNVYMMYVTPQFTTPIRNDKVTCFKVFLSRLVILNYWSSRLGKLPMMLPQGCIGQFQ